MTEVNFSKKLIRKLLAWLTFLFLLFVQKFIESVYLLIHLGVYATYKGFIKVLPTLVKVTNIIKYLEKINYKTKHQLSRMFTTYFKKKQSLK